MQRNIVHVFLVRNVQINCFLLQIFWGLIACQRKVADSKKKLGVPRVGDTWMIADNTFLGGVPRVGDTWMADSSLVKTSFSC